MLTQIKLHTIKLNNAIKDFNLMLGLTKTNSIYALDIFLAMSEMGLDAQALAQQLTDHIGGWSMEKSIVGQIDEALTLCLGVTDKTAKLAALLAKADTNQVFSSDELHRLDKTLMMVVLANTDLINAYAACARPTHKH